MVRDEWLATLISSEIQFFFAACGTEKWHVAIVQTVIIYASIEEVAIGHGQKQQQETNNALICNTPVAKQAVLHGFMIVDVFLCAESSGGIVIVQD